MQALSDWTCGHAVSVSVNNIYANLVFPLTRPIRTFYASAWERCEIKPTEWFQPSWKRPDADEILFCLIFSKIKWALHVKTCPQTYADIDGPDQPVCSCSLIRPFSALLQNHWLLYMMHQLTTKYRNVRLCWIRAFIIHFRFRLAWTKYL